ncbi:MAG: rhodanese-like domain-containing protein [Chloroflexota bacterium]
MNSRKYALLLVVMVLALMGIAQVAAQDATVTPEVTTAFDIQPVLVDYLQNLPDGFSGVKPEAALKELTGEVKPFLIDVRDEKDITDGGYIAGAVLIPIRTLTENLDKLPAQDQPILVYCGIGHRGAVAVEVLNLLGYTNVRSIFGGFTGWKAAGLPVETGIPAEPVVSDAVAPEFDPALFTAVDAFITTMPDGFYAASPTAVLKSLGEEPQPFLIDVRGEQELKDNGYIESEVNIPLKTLLDKPELLPVDKDVSIIVYCAIGHRGAMAMTTLRLLGYTDVTSIGGGFNNWVKGGLPIVKPA